MFQNKNIPIIKKVDKETIPKIPANRLFVKILSNIAPTPKATKF